MPAQAAAPDQGERDKSSPERPHRTLSADFIYTAPLGSLGNSYRISPGRAGTYVLAKHDIASLPQQRNDATAHPSIAPQDVAIMIPASFSCI